MSSTTIAVDLAKHVFELAIATQTFRIAERKRLTRSQFERLWATREPSRVLLSAGARLRGRVTAATVCAGVPPAQQDRPSGLRSDPGGIPVRGHPPRGGQE